MDAQVWDKPGGHGPVTEADLEVNNMLHAELLSNRPGYGWLSEETPDTAARLGSGKVFIIDPIDGTRAFIEGARSFAHSLAVAEDGQVTDAVVYLPMLDKLYVASLGQGATLNGRPIRPSATADLDGATLLVAKPNLSPEHWPRGVPPVIREFRSSLAYRLCLVAEGRFDAMLTLRDCWEWDIAAGELILREAGAEVSDRAGLALRFNNRVPQTPGVLAAGPEVHRGLLGALRK